MIGRANQDCGISTFCKPIQRDGIVFTGAAACSLIQQDTQRSGPV